jgi:hypothetical protein
VDAEQTRIERLTELARKVWPDRNVSVQVGDSHNEIGAGVIADADEDWAQLVIVDSHPCALDALEAALLALAGELVGPTDLDRGSFESMRHNAQRYLEQAKRDRAELREAQKAYRQLRDRLTAMHKGWLMALEFGVECDAVGSAHESAIRACASELDDALKEPANG